jgi:hypothetical protein
MARQETASPGGGSIRAIDDIVERLGLQSVDLVKIDIEGFEIDALRGMTNTVERFAPLLLVELNAFTISAFRNISPMELLEYIRNHVGHIFYLADDGSLGQAVSDQELVGLLHRNMLLHGCVDDLLIVPPRHLLSGALGARVAVRPGNGVAEHNAAQSMATPIEIIDGGTETTLQKGKRWLGAHLPRPVYQLAGSVYRAIRGTTKPSRH